MPHYTHTLDAYGTATPEEIISAGYVKLVEDIDALRKDTPEDFTCDHSTRDIADDIFQECESIIWSRT